ncbi:hypothetical protein [Listeria immobilis]|uniref:hypothetical protein n=1 Tax=Listeria immobilis TaxID=2713502 RepID=UPI001623F711|nr:hypothetical protein [Listeria immobilis]MBC1515058.1 hypothetical protein [Listeria immobilis]
MKIVGSLGRAIGFIMIFGSMAYIFFNRDNMEVFSSSAFRYTLYGGIAILVISSILPLVLSGFGGRVKNGVPALGIIESVRQTGTYINEQPQVELKIQVTEESGKQFDTTITTIIPLTQLASFQINSPINVLVGENRKVGLPKAGDPTLSQEKMQSIFNVVAVKKGLISKESLEISQNGVESYATVKAMRPRGSLTAERVELELDLDLTKVDQSIVPVSVVKTFPGSSVEQLQPGRVVSVIYLPNQPEKLVIKTVADANTAQSAFQKG